MVRSHRRRPRHDEDRARPWVQFTCACALGGVVCVVALRPTPQARVVVQPASIPCAIIDAVAALAFQGVTPPSDATPEDVRATAAVNDRLLNLAKQVSAIRSSREGCS